MKQRYRYENYQVGAVNIRLKLPLDLDKIADSSLPGVSREAFPRFGMVWSSSECLAHLLALREFGAQRVLELGCGMALATHVMNARGVNVTALDIHPMAGELLSENCALNESAPVPFVAASWSDEQVYLGLFDLIVASDVLYEPRHAVHLAPFLDRHLSESGEVMIVDPDRGQLSTFLLAMEQLGFAWDRESPDFVDQMGVAYAGSVYRFRRVPAPAEPAG